MSDQFVYFIQADENGPIKIGFTSDDPKRRLNQLQTGNAATLRLLGSIRADISRERQFHSDLAEWRLQGEWFEPHPTVLTSIEQALTTEAPHDCGGKHCSFCHECQRNCLSLIAGPNDIFICSQCVVLCAEIVSQHLVQTTRHIDLAGCPVEMGYGG